MKYIEETFSIQDIVHELQTSVFECSLRGLYDSTKWAAELLDSIKDKNSDYDFQPETPFQLEPELKKEFNHYLLAKSFFEKKEFRRAHFSVKHCESQTLRFLKYYSLFLDGERLKNQRRDQAKNPESCNRIINDELNTIYCTLSKLSDQNELDGYELYLYGLILKERQDRTEALAIFIKAVHAVPHFYAPWLEITNLTANFDIQPKSALPEHWMYDFYLAQNELDQQKNEVAVDLYEELSDICSHGNFLLSRVAKSKYNLRDFDEAQRLLMELHRRDPECLESLDMLSDILHVQKEREILGDLAHDVAKVNIRRPQSCCVVGNYYSLQGEHEKAVLYFRRAIMLNPRYTAAWVFMGHEYLDLTNIPKAIEAYRTALELNPKEYRAWYKLGYSYETLRLFPYALHYYKKASMIRPQDERLSGAVETLTEYLQECGDS